MSPKKITDAVEILHRDIADSPEHQEALKEARLNARIAQMIYDARTEAGLTQAQLAELVGTSQSAIARLEDANYEGHSVRMLQKIAEALHKELHLAMV